MIVSNNDNHFGLGISAALIGSFLSTIGFYIWDNYWKGSAFALNLLKCNFASIGFFIISLIQQQRNSSTTPFFSSDIFTKQDVGYLLVSSIIGIIIGDITWLYALQLLGAKRVILMDTMKPFFASFLGWYLLNEKLQYAAIGGVLLTIIGVVTVSLENINDDNASTNNNIDSNHDDDNSNNNMLFDDNNDNNNNKDTCETPGSLSNPTNNKQRNTELTVIKVESTSVKSANSNFMLQSTETQLCTRNNNNNNNRSNINSNECLSDEEKHINNMNRNNNNHDDEDDTNDNNDDKKDNNDKDSGRIEVCTFASEYQTFEFFHDSDDEDDKMMISATKDQIIHNQFNCHSCGNNNSTNNNNNNCLRSIIKNNNNNKLLVGTLFSIINIVLDTYGSVLTKQHGKNMTVWEINLVRFGFAGICLLCISILFHIRDYLLILIESFSNNNNNNNTNNNVIKTINQTTKHTTTFHSEEDGTDLPSSFNTITTSNNAISPTSTINSLSTPNTKTTASNTRNTPYVTPWYALPIRNSEMTRSAWYHIFTGTVFVTFLHPTLSNYALFQIALGLALTLGSTGPLYSLFISYIIMLRKHQRDTTNNNNTKRRILLPSIQSVLGSLLSVAGIIVLAFRGTLPEAN